jgi:hypothetical protein
MNHETAAKTTVVLSSLFSSRENHGFLFSLQFTFFRPCFDTIMKKPSFTTVYTHEMSRFHCQRCERISNYFKILGRMDVSVFRS